MSQRYALRTLISLAVLIGTSGIAGGETLPVASLPAIPSAWEEASVGQSSQGSGRTRTVARRGSGIYPLAGYDPTIPAHADLEPLGRLIGDASVVALGESYHTSAGFYRMKHRIFRYLVEEKGFRAFAIESYWEGAERAAEYVRTCNGSPRQAISMHINVWQSAEYAEFVEWMCDWNRVHSDPADWITLFGFDIQQPWHDGPALMTFLERIGIPRSDPRSEGIRHCEGVEGPRYPIGQIPPLRHATCVQSLDAIEEHLEANRSNIIQRTSANEFEVALLRTIGLRAWEEQVFIIAHDFAAGYNARDEGMAYAFHAMRAMKAPGAKTVVWAANSHVARNPLPRGERPIGSYLAEAFGPDYVTIALTAYETEIDFPGHGCGLVARTPGSVEDELAVHGLEALLSIPADRGPEETVYTMGTDQVRPDLDYDGIIYLQHSPKMNPYVWASCR